MKVKLRVNIQLPRANDPNGKAACVRSQIMLPELHQTTLSTVSQPNFHQNLLHEPFHLGSSWYNCCLTSVTLYIHPTYLNDRASKGWIQASMTEASQYSQPPPFTETSIENLIHLTSTSMKVMIPAAPPSREG